MPCNNLYSFIAFISNKIILEKNGMLSTEIIAQLSHPQNIKYMYENLAFGISLHTYLYLIIHPNSLEFIQLFCKFRFLVDLGN